ncbi:MAG: bifunctional adenosylcobinamide kinase/adenosylcobinamide-phosphate guanylyltransferase [Nitrospirae bacterium]|nr:bifunctional adenosylcobinamide kinase/adenosylcobinamide-phosphate guanylyltransferase [Nitrospirota bacterium]
MITFIIGGARSGKSRFALEKASLHSGKKAYIATAQALDSEMKERIEKHKKERSVVDSTHREEWITIEEPLNIPALINNIHAKYDVILIDCLTLWLSNLMLADKDIGTEIETFCSSLSTVHCSLFAVSNEVGMGIVPDNELSRRFRDMAGHLNQKVAGIANEVYSVTAGIPLKIKQEA